MKNKELIISLIEQDLKHNQLVLGLERIGVNATDVHFLEILDIVAQLMEVPREGEMGEVWANTYVSFMNQALNYEITGRGQNLRPLAKACYSSLKAVLKYDTVH